MPLQPSQVLKAVVASTTKHLELLNKQRLSEVRHPARSIVREEDLFTVNKKMLRYRCSLPPHLGFQPNTTATFIPTRAPGNEFEVCIEKYNRTSGVTIFASETEILAKSGHIVIDFRWLIRRCLDWYGSRGTSLHSPDALMVRNPKKAFVPPDGMSAEQILAVNTMLKNELSYVWGPPGTGKTKMVLNSAVRHCVDQGLKVLVVAPTNLGVDNALIGILEGDIEHSTVLRVGIPSDEFINDYPECCEDRVATARIKEFRAEIERLRGEIETIYRLRKLPESIASMEREMRLIESGLPDLREQLPEHRNAFHLEDAKKLHAQQLIDDIQTQLSQSKEQLADLQLSERKREIQVLERDQTQLIAAMHENSDAANNLGIIANHFTDKPRQLSRARQGLRSRLNSVEMTLASKREFYREQAPYAQQLSDEIAQMKVKLNNAYDERDLAASNATSHEAAIGALELQVGEQENALETLKNEHKTCCTELHQIGQSLPQGDHEHIELNNNKRISELQQQIDAFTQNFGDKDVLGMTLDGFIGLTMQHGIDVDHIFVDEAAYASLAKTIPLLSIGCPISMLGDHYQLPPVCAGPKNNPCVQAYWGKSAIFLENAFIVGNKYTNLMKQTPFRHSLKWTKTSILRQSHRYSAELASVLEEHIYKIGFTGVAQANISIGCRHCSPLAENGNKPWQNIAEVNSVAVWVKKWWLKKQQGEINGTAAVLTPYKNQVSLIRRELLGHFQTDHMIWEDLEIMHTHKSQGREWDTVFFSAVDSGNLRGNRPFLADTNTPEGRAVVNTSISRAKSHLRIFLDRRYWCNLENSSMLTAFAKRYQAL